MFRLSKAVAASLLVLSFVASSMVLAGDLGQARVSTPPPNNPPELTPLADLLGIAGASLEFRAYATDPENDGLTYTWDFGDGSPNAVGNPVSHAYILAGRYTYSVHVDDSNGNNVSSSAFAWAAFPIALFPGWSLVSLPVVGWNYMASTLPLDPGDVVTGFDSATQSYRTYTVGISPPFRDFPVIPTQGYWIYTGTSKTMDILGDVPTDPVSVTIPIPAAGGWALIGFVGLNSHKASSIPAMCTGGNIVMVARYQLPYHTFQTWVYGGPPFRDFYLLPGEGFFIFATATLTMSYNP